MDNSQELDGNEPDAIDYLKREGFASRHVEIRDAEEGHQPDDAISPEPGVKRRRRGWTPGCTVLFGTALPVGRLCSEEPESDQADSDDDTISCPSPAPSEATHAMSDSSSPPDIGVHSPASSPAKACLGDIPESTVVASIEQEDLPLISVELNEASSPGTLEPGRRAIEEGRDQEGRARSVSDAGGARDSLLARRSPTPPNHWRCHHVGCEAGLFKSKFQLDSHQIRHNGVRDQQCTHGGCDKSFKRRNELARHMRSVHGTNGHVCRYCHTAHSFARSDTLRRHIRRVHPDLVPT